MTDAQRQFRVHSCTVRIAIQSWRHGRRVGSLKLIQTAQWRLDVGKLVKINAALPMRPDAVDNVRALADVYGNSVLNQKIDSDLQLIFNNESLCW